MMQFFASVNPLGPFDVPHADTNSITGGKINAKPDEHKAPINEMNAFSAGTSSANESKSNQIEIVYVKLFFS